MNQININTMAKTETIAGVVPVPRGPYDSGNTYYKYNLTQLYGSTYMSKIDNNTTAPATMDAEGNITVNENWEVWVDASGVPALRKEIKNMFYRFFDYLLAEENLLDVSKIVEGKYINDADGKILDNEAFVGTAISDFIYVHKSGMYKAYEVNRSSIHLYSCWGYNYKQELVGKLTSTGWIKTGFNVPEDVKFVRLCWIKSSGEWDLNTVKSCVLRNMNLPAPTVYVPYNTFYIQDDALRNSELMKDLIAKVSSALTEPMFSAFEKYFVSRGLNLFDWTQAKKGYYISISGESIEDIRVTPTEGYGAISDFIPVKPNTTYSVNFAINSSNKVVGFYNSDKKALFTGKQLILETSATFTTTEDTKYIVVSFGIGEVTDQQLKGLQVQEGEEIVYSNFQELHDYIMKPETGNPYLEDYLKEKNVALYTTVVGSKNLFNKDTVIDEYYINITTGELIKYEGTAMSPLIPVQEGHIYYLQRAVSIGTHGVRFVSEDGETPIKALKENGEEYNLFSLKTTSGVVKAPIGAKYFQFTCKFGGKDCDYNATQFEEGNTFTGYEPFSLKDIIDYPNLPKDLSGLSERVDALESNSSLETITIANSDKIGFFSNSFLNGYCMLGKHAINNLSMFSDYIMYNYGHSGDDLLELLDRINSNEKWLGEVPVQDWGIKYGVIAMQDNDGALFAAASDTYYQNAKKMSEAIKAMGGIPILSTEHDDNRYYYNFARLAQEEGYMMMNWGYKAEKLFNRRFNPFWYNGHPATRTAWMWTYGMKPYLDTLPRPNKAIKLFRLRNSVDTSNLQNLIYDDFVSRAERFEELTCGVIGLSEETDKYFDRQDGSQKQYITYKDEYQIIQTKMPVSFGSYALVEVVTPYDKNGISKLSIDIKQTGVSKVYIKKTNSLQNPLPKNRVIAFGVTAGSENLSKGTTFNITGGVFNDNIKGEYTVEDIVNGIVVTTTSSTGKTTSGTDDPICDIEGVTLQGSYDYPTADYMQRYNKPLGEWVELIAEADGSYTLDYYLSTCMMYDKVGLLLEGSEITISDIQCKVGGSTKKNGYSKPLAAWKEGNSLLTDILFDDETSWTGVDSLEKYEPVASTVTTSMKESLPTGVTTVRKMTAGDTVGQSIVTSELSNSGYEPFNIQIRVVARYFPEYIDTDQKWETSELKRGTFDCAKLAVMIGTDSSDANPVKVAEIAVGAWWNEFIINSQYYTGGYMQLKCLDKHLQIAKCEIVRV